MTFLRYPEAIKPKRLYYVYRWTREDMERHAAACGERGETVEHFARGTVHKRDLSFADAALECELIRTADTDPNSPYEYGFTDQINTIFLEDKGHA